MPITKKKVMLLRHTLGGPECFRNHFVAGHGHHDMKDILELVEDGYMFEGSFCSFIGEGERIFHATAKGKLEAVSNWDFDRIGN